MRYVTFGTTNESVSEICLGTMMFANRCDEGEAEQIVDRALELGINFIDTAAMYEEGRTEEMLGRILRGKRNDFFLATKVHEGTDRRTILESIERSLSRLQTDYVDLYLIHWPRKGMDPHEVMSALNEVVRAGKARFVGCSNYPAWLLAHSNAIAEKEGWPALACNQVPYNLIERGVEVEVLPQARAQHIAIVAYRVLVMGLLTRKYRPGEPLPRESRAQTDDRIVNWLEQYAGSISTFFGFADELEVSPATLALAWVRHSPAVACAILGVSSVEQLEKSARGFDFRLSTEDYETLTGMFKTEVWEEAGGAYPALRRELALLDSS